MKIFCSLLATAILLCSAVGFAGCGTNQGSESDSDVTVEQTGGGTFHSPHDMGSKFFSELHH